MGQHDDAELARRDKKKGKKRASAPWAKETTVEDVVRWSMVEEMLIAQVVDATCQGNASVQFTRSRDGGALGVRVYDESFIPRTQWGRPGGEIEEILRKIGGYYDTIEEEDQAK